MVVLAGIEPSVAHLKDERIYQYSTAPLKIIIFICHPSYDTTSPQELLNLIRLERMTLDLII